MEQNSVSETDGHTMSRYMGGATTQVALHASGLVKTYPGTRALSKVDFTVRAGETHGLCGGNGCGKSTMLKILSGVFPANAGTIQIYDDLVDATSVRPETMRDLGIRVVHQDLALFPDASIAENLALGATFPVRAGTIRWSELRRRSQDVLDRFEIDARPGTLLRELPVGLRTQVAIARALQDISDRGIIMLDEPTAALPVDEVDDLLTAVRRLAQQGHSIIFVSHRLDEVMSVTDRVTVMRDGQVMAEHTTAELTESELIESILGTRVTDMFANNRIQKTGRSILEVSGLDSGPLQDVDLSINEGEVVGIAGLLGSGRTELLRTIYGDLKRNSGEIKVDGVPVEFTRPDQAISRGVVLIPEDRVSSALLPDMTVDENMNVSVLKEFWQYTGFRQRQMSDEADDLRSRFKVKTETGSKLIKALSGGNQQKAILARWFRRKPILLLLDEPTQGVDIGARADIYRAIRQVVADSGGAALVVTSDLEEMAQVVDRAVVLKNGRLVAVVNRAELTAHHLNELIYSERQETSDV